MEEKLKEELAVEAASRVHQDWCLQELKAFFDRAKEGYESGKYPGEALREACLKGGVERNELDLDTGFLVGHPTFASRMFSNFDEFVREFFKSGEGPVVVKRFVERDLTEEEKDKAKARESSIEYKDGKENILRPFEKLSIASQKENLDAARGAVKVYIELSQAGVSIDEMLNDPELREQIGIAIHTDWLERNKDHPNESLKVPYKKLDEWTQGQDLTVFNAMIGVVQSDPKYLVGRVEGAVIPDYQAEEREVLGLGATR